MPIEYLPSMSRPAVKPAAGDEAAAGGPAASLARTARELYRSRIPRWYDPVAHFAIILALGTGAIYAAASGIAQIGLAGLIVILAAAAFFNVAEWSLHRFIEHMPRRPFEASYRRHVLGHHRFFNSADKLLEQPIDCRIVLFPPYTLVLIMAVALVTAIPAAVALGPGEARLWFISIVVMYLVYEVVHLLCHARSARIVNRIPLVNTIRRHHLAHHDETLMAKYNFNLTVACSDWLFGTSDLKGGLLRHLFNGSRSDRRKVSAGKASRRAESRYKLQTIPEDPHQRQRSAIGGLVTGGAAAAEGIVLFGTTPQSIALSAFVGLIIAGYASAARL